MRIVIDLQGAQAENRFRGIGRFSLALAKAIVRNRANHDVLIALNGLFPDAVDAIRAEFKDVLPTENLRVWYVPESVCAINTANNVRIKAAEYIREVFLAELQPDILLVTSLFEGLVDNAVTSVKKFIPNIRTAVVLYDLIPKLFPNVYFENNIIQRWYSSKISQISQADVLLAISETTKKDALEHLDLFEDRIVNISAAITSNIGFISLSVDQINLLCLRYVFARKIIMYTGGCDFRKNVENLIKAYACLSLELKKEYQLVIVCSINEPEKKRFQEIASKKFLEPNDVIFTGYVPEEDLVLLYNMAYVFIFPSLYEGFGLPVLEAMSCGVPTLGSNTSSIPEVIGLEEALFDPYSVESMTAKLSQVLTDELFREKLIRHGLEQVKKFSWDKSAQRTIEVLEDICQESTSSPPLSNSGKSTLAYLSPLPPARSGIADYSAELLPELAKYYEIILITEQDVINDSWINLYCSVRSCGWFQENYLSIDRILYHFGNSSFHGYMFPLLEEISGIVVLHDFFLSGVQQYREIHENIPFAWTKALIHSHGYKAASNRFDVASSSDAVWDYPSNLDVLEQARGVIVHSDHSQRLAYEWYGKECAQSFSVIPLLRTLGGVMSRDDARRAINFPEDAFVFCSFGLLGPIKLNHRLLQAWLRSRLSKNTSCILIFVGEKLDCSYCLELAQTIQDNGLEKQVRITGWVDMPTFRNYLASADVAVQLRTLSRGETSAAVLDCMNYGIPTIVNANGSMAALPSDAVWKLPDDFSDEELIDALETLFL